MPDAPPTSALAGWRWFERLFDRAFGAAGNPLRQLGTLGFLAFWLLALSGIWLYVVLDTSVAGAYVSIDALSRDPWSPGGLMRSLHRYAADAFVLFSALHLLCETLHGRWRHFRRSSWWTGSALLPLLAVSAIGGFWLAWDRLGQFSAIATTEWLDTVPGLAQPLARNFLANEAVSDRLFSLLVFIHLGVPLLLLFGLWFHLQRITQAAVFPPRALALGTTGSLLLVAVAAPVAGQGPADLATAPTLLSMDWFLLFLHPLMYASSAGVAWALATGTWVLLMALPFWPARPRGAAEGAGVKAAAAPPVAVVDPQNCNGCRRCLADCPYAAITMRPHPDGRMGRELAVVDADLCASCGICAGACPSSTPFRHGARLHTGIDMPQWPLDDLRRRLRQGLEATKAPRPMVLFTCAQGARDHALAAAPDLVLLPLICTGQLPPSFVDYARRDGAAGILVASCRDGGCAFRLGARWTADRLAGRREPHLRADPDASAPLHLVQADAGESARLSSAVQAMRENLCQVKAVSGPGAKMPHG